MCYQSRNIKLVDLYNKLFSENFEAHDALEDSYAALRCYVQIKNKKDMKAEIDLAKMDFNINAINNAI